MGDEGRNGILRPPLRREENVAVEVECFLPPRLACRDDERTDLTEHLYESQISDAREEKPNVMSTYLERLPVFDVEARLVGELERQWD